MSVNAIVPLVGPIYGSIYFAVVMSTSFYGVACMQTYENDPLRTKILVAVLWALNTIHEALCVAGAYKYIMGGIVSPYSFVVANPELVLSQWEEHYFATYMGEECAFKQKFESRSAS
ncbi:hypothetical protein L210DRAFT_3503866 [Boletus edulis BED1]|uniref:Uncharacterized protein n=1 Tax=Boletus edulis BED1 TaxID=1328754 RepID=A0AAD4BVG0_BOLED|nr:hypothetical protein L210DRAFT_3503866 [Boletus edulis BED1]